MIPPDHAVVKNSLVIEAMLFQAAGFLDDSELFELDNWTKEQYEKDQRIAELTTSMLSLESIALAHGAKSGFWRRLKKVANQLERTDKAEEYERKFHEALRDVSK